MRSGLAVPRDGVAGTSRASRSLEGAAAVFRAVLGVDLVRLDVLGLLEALGLLEVLGLLEASAAGALAVVVLVPTAIGAKGDVLNAI